MKSLVGHCLSGAGSIENVASVLQLHHGFVFPNINCADLHPEITALIDQSRIPQQLIEKELNIITTCYNNKVIKHYYGTGESEDDEENTD